MKKWISGMVAMGVVASVATASPVYDYNLIVLNDLDSTSEVEGRTFVGGNLTGPSSTYATKLTPAGDFLGVDTLIVGGNINTNAININAGNLRHGGSISGAVNMNGGGSITQDGGIGAEAAAIGAELFALANSLSQLSDNSVVNLPNGQPGPAKFIASPGGPDNIAVFSVDGNDLLSNSLVQQIELEANGASSIVVNVFGSSIDFDMGNFVGSWNTDAIRAITIWNFYEATSLDFDRLFNGAVLAPGAHLSNSTVIAGGAFVKSFDQDGEVHLPNYVGYVPEPASLALMAIGAFALTRRNRT